MYREKLHNIRVSHLPDVDKLLATRRLARQIRRAYGHCMAYWQVAAHERLLKRSILERRLSNI